MQAMFRKTWSLAFLREVMTGKSRGAAARAALVHKEIPAVEEITDIVNAVHLRSMRHGLRRDDWLSLGPDPFDVAAELEGAAEQVRPAPYLALNHFLGTYRDFFTAPDLLAYVSWLLAPER
jgi:hypothetical protein